MILKVHFDRLVCQVLFQVFLSEYGVGLSAQVMDLLRLIGIREFDIVELLDDSTNE